MITLEIDPSTFDGDNNPKEVMIDDICIVNPNDNWHLYNHGHLELTKNCDQEYISLWDFPLNLHSPNILIVGGGDYQFVKHLCLIYMPEIDLVDPYVNMYDEFHQFYLQEYYYKCKAYTNEYKKTFNKYLENYSNKHYNITIIDCSEPVMGLTDEIYSEQFFKNLLKINSDIFMMYIPPTVYNKLIPIIREYFDITLTKGKFIKDWNEYCDVITFIKK